MPVRTTGCNLKESIAVITPDFAATLVARDEGGGSYRFDIHLRGEGQTAFFEFAG